jgi:glycosyltransferase involved in cell wall biosynthesis
MSITIGVVSISYNQAKYVSACVDSIVSQILERDHYVVVDPGSTDGSREKILDLCQNRKNVSLLFERDRGAADGLNKGFACNTADVIGYINSDDFLIPGALEFVREFFEENPSVDVLIGGVKIATGNGSLLRRGRLAEVPDMRKFLTSGFLYFQQGTFMRRSIFEKVGGFNEENKTCWDYELIIDMAIEGAKFRVVNKPLGAFRIHSESITGRGENGVAHMHTMDRLRLKVRDRGFTSLGFAAKIYYTLDRKFSPVRFVNQYLMK